MSVVDMRNVNIYDAYNQVRSFRERLETPTGVIYSDGSNSCHDSKDKYIIEDKMDPMDVAGIVNKFIMKEPLYYFHKYENSGGIALFAEDYSNDIAALNKFLEDNPGLKYKEVAFREEIQVCYMLKIDWCACTAAENIESIAGTLDTLGEEVADLAGPKFADKKHLFNSFAKVRAQNLTIGRDVERMFLNAMDYVDKNGSNAGMTAEDISKGTKLVKYEDYIAIDDLLEASHEARDAYDEAKRLAYEQKMTKSEFAKMLKYDNLLNLVKFKQLTARYKCSRFFTNMINPAVDGIEYLLDMAAQNKGGTSDTPL